MKTLSVLVAVLALAASPLVAAQSATVPTDDVGNTGTDTAVIQTVPSDNVGNTGTDTAVTGTTLPTDDVGHTGTDTMTTAAPAPALSLQAASSSMVGPNTMKITAIIAADPNATSTTASTTTVPLASSNAACTVPASVDVTWTPSQGGTASFSATCAKVSSNTSVTISSGSASTSFSLNRK